MEYLPLIGIVIVILGFSLKLDNILTIMLAIIATALVGGLGVGGLLETLGSSFVTNRSLAVFIVVLLVTGTLERSGLKEAAAALIGKIKNANAGVVIGAYGIMRSIFAIFNVSFGGVAGFVRPVIMPMAEAAVKKEEGVDDVDDIDEDHLEQVKGMASGMENVAWFFCSVLFIGGAGGLLVQGTLKGLGYNVSLVDLAKVEIPVAIFALVFTLCYYFVRDRRLGRKAVAKRKEGGN